MCITLPAVVIGPAPDGNKWEVESLGGARASVVSQIERISAGEYVRIYAGAIVEKITRRDYLETISMWEEIGKAMREAEAPIQTATLSGVPKGGGV